MRELLEEELEQVSGGAPAGPTFPFNGEGRKDGIPLSPTYGVTPEGTTDLKGWAIHNPTFPYV